MLTVCIKQQLLLYNYRFVHSTVTWYNEISWRPNFETLFKILKLKSKHLKLPHVNYLLFTTAFKLCNHSNIFLEKLKQLSLRERTAVELKQNKITSLERSYFRTEELSKCIEALLHFNQIWKQLIFSLQNISSLEKQNDLPSLHCIMPLSDLTCLRVCFKSNNESKISPLVHFCTNRNLKPAENSIKTNSIELCGEKYGEICITIQLCITVT